MRDDREVMRAAASQHGVVGGGEARASGLSASALHRRKVAGHLVRVRPRVFHAAGAPSTWRADLFAAVLWAGEGALASHRSAAALWHLDGWEDGPVELVVPVARAPRGQRGVRVHRMKGLEPNDRVEIDGIAATGIALTVVHLASFLRTGQLATALDSALAQGLTRPERVLERLDLLGRTGRKGARTLATLLGERMDGQRPPANRFERRLGALLVRGGLAEPVRQYGIELEGRSDARPDLAYPDLRIAIEADSHRWHGSRSSWERDLERRSALAAAGWLVLHFSWRDLVDRPQFVVGAVARTVEFRRSAP